jgi:hypothetical protein
MYLMLNRFTVSIAFLAGLVSVAMAQDMHVFSNGTVADADKINDNFAAIDQEGPTITYSEPVMEADGLSGNVTVTISDPSGLFGYGAGNCYPCSSTSSWRESDQQLLFNGETSVQFGIDVYTYLNGVSSLVYYATDLRGNKSVKKVDYQGLTTFAKAGLYEASSPLVLDDLCNAGGGSVSLNYLSIELSPVAGKAHPVISLSAGLCESAFNSGCNGRTLVTGLVEGLATDASWSFSLDAEDSPYDRTVALTFSNNGLSAVATYDEVVDCSFTGGQVETQSGSLTLTYKTKP